ncbi:hypothetical protein NL676_001171 [Syzygium grande]|nr:hypothetical protein NL676_001171 [Syzygium grande]
MSALHYDANHEQWQLQENPILTFSQKIHESTASFFGTFQLKNREQSNGPFLFRSWEREELVERKTMELEKRGKSPFFRDEAMLKSYVKRREVKGSEL